MDQNHTNVVLGIVFAVANTMGNIPGFVAPTVVGFLLTDYSNSYQWYGVFWIRYDNN